MNRLDPLDIEWRHSTHMTLTTGSHFVCRDERYGDPVGADNEKRWSR